MSDMLCVHSGIELFMNASSVWQCNVRRLVLCVGSRCDGAAYEYMYTSCTAPMVCSFLSTTAQLHATHGKGGRRRKRHSTSTRE
jgi:hypothetical protein